MPLSHLSISGRSGCAIHDNYNLLRVLEDWLLHENKVGFIQLEAMQNGNHARVHKLTF